MAATTMMATNMFSEDVMTVNWKFLKSTLLVFHVFFAVAIMVCGPGLMLR